MSLSVASARGWIAGRYILGKQEAFPHRLAGIKPKNFAAAFEGNSPACLGRQIEFKKAVALLPFDSRQATAVVLRRLGNEGSFARRMAVGLEQSHDPGASVEKADYHNQIVDPHPPQEPPSGWHPPQSLPSQPSQKPPAISPTVIPYSPTPPIIHTSGPTPYKPSDNKDYHDVIVDPSKPQGNQDGWHPPQSLPPATLPPAPIKPPANPFEVETSGHTPHIPYKP